MVYSLDIGCLGSNDIYTAFPPTVDAISSFHFVGLRVVAASTCTAVSSVSYEPLPHSRTLAFGAIIALGRRVAQLDSRLPNASISHAKRRPLSLVNHARESVFVGKDKKEEDTKYRSD